MISTRTTAPATMYWVVVVGEESRIVIDYYSGLHADQAAIADHCRIGSRKLDARIGGQNGKGVIFSLEPHGTQIGRASFGRNDVCRLEQSIKDIFLTHFQKHLGLLHIQRVRRGWHRP